MKNGIEVSGAVELFDNAINNVLVKVLNLHKQIEALTLEEAEALHPELIEGKHYWIKYSGIVSCLWCCKLHRGVDIAESVCPGRIALSINR